MAIPLIKKKLTELAHDVDSVTQQINVVWRPLPGTSQELAISCPANEILYCGTRGCGKTDVQIMKFAKYVGLGYGRFWRGIIFDREYKNLDDLVSRTKRWFYELYGDQATFLASKSEYKWVWKTGEELLIRTMKNEEDYDDYHGQEFPFIGWNELTKYPDKNCYESMLSCNRSSFTPEKDAPKDKNGKPTIGEIPLVVFSTTNPYGAGRGWVKRRFIDGFRYGQLNRRTSMIFNPREQKEMPYTAIRVALFGHYKENIYLSPQYIATLGDITNKNKRAAWLEGRWDVAAGGAFEECWDDDIHILNDFTVPSGWTIFPTFDWGSSAPFAVTWWAHCNGEEAYVPLGDGTFYTFTPPAGTLVLVSTWYGSDGNGAGLRLGATEIAVGMKERVADMFKKWYVMPDVKFEVGSADGQIFNRINDDDPTIADWFEKEGVEWERADKSKGSRVNGLALTQERMLASLKGNGRPALYVMRRNADWVDTVTTLPTDPKNPDDIDTEAEDHLYDATRYAVLRVSNVDTANIKVQMPC